MKRLILGLLLLITSPAYAAILSGELKNNKGAAIPNAVITAFPTQGELPAPNSAEQPKSLDQVNREFISHVLVIRTGDRVIFPNNDKTKHHVYSFSPTHRFEIKLYSGVPSEPILFDKPGVVVLGCNIHDWMVGYIYVTDTPYFASTDASGHWRIDLPENDYKLTIWHENLDAPDNTISKTITVTEGENVINDSINLKFSLRNGKPPDTLQEQGYQSEP